MAAGGNRNSLAQGRRLVGLVVIIGFAVGLTVGLVVRSPSIVTWTAIAAMATTLMAVATGYLGWKTRAMAAETGGVARATLKEAEAVKGQTLQAERQLTLATDGLHANVQPWLVWVSSFTSDTRRSLRHGVPYPPGTHPALDVSERADGSVVGWFIVRNVGNGLAVIELSESYIYPKNGHARFEGVHLTVDTPILAPGDTIDVSFTIPATASFDGQRMTLQEVTGGVGNELLAVSLAYGDSLGLGNTIATFRMHRNLGERRQWSVFEVEYQLPGDRMVTTRRFG